MRPFKTLILAALICFPANSPQSVTAQEEKSDPPPQTETEKPTDAPPDADKPGEAEESSDDIQAQWNKFSARKGEIALKLSELKKTFQSASVEDKVEIQKEFRDLVREYLLEIEPVMSELAGKIYAANPDDVEAGEFQLQNLFAENEYKQAADLAQKLIDAGHLTGTVLKIGGVANFAEHNFEKGLELLTQAKSRNALNEYQFAKYLMYGEDYPQMWEKEQAIREKEANAPEGEQNPRVELQTSKGKILLELFENEAPNTAANFISLAESGFYDKVLFHRVEPNFVIQGGDPNSKDEDPANDGRGGPGYTIKCECFREDARMHFSGSLSMAHAGRDTGGSQFFITHLPTPVLNPDNGSQSNHTVFGRVIEGLDVVRAIEKNDVIEKATVVRKRDHEYKPETTPRDE